MERFFLTTALLFFFLFLFSLAASFGVFRRIQGFFKRLIPLCLALLFLAVTLLTGMVAWGLRSYRQLQREELVAVISCERPFEPGADFTLVYTSAIPKEQMHRTRSFQIRGNEWAFGGAVVRWKGWARFLGARTLYRPLWIEGRADGRQQSFYPFKETFDPIWFLLSRFGEGCPFVEATYGSSVSAPPIHQIQFHLYVTESGFAVKKVVSYFRDIS